MINDNIVIARSSLIVGSSNTLILMPELCISSVFFILRVPGSESTMTNYVFLLIVVLIVVLIAALYDLNGSQKRIIRTQYHNWFRWNILAFYSRLLAVNLLAEVLLFFAAVFDTKFCITTY